ncbi:MAG: hypothetical protein NT125_09020 [Candidatus Bipolaricaulota bacterium]|nr:hypothetical protein [Candidatus Bipolaricaulota bacterium]
MFPSENLPVPAEVLVYTAKEWQSREEPSFLKTIEKEVVWILEDAQP